MHSEFLRLAAALSVALLAGPYGIASAQQSPDRTTLPIREPARPLYTELDARKVQPPPRFEIKAPDGAPNVLIVLLDDMGFGVSSSFGGPAHMPTAERLAAEGLRYNNFHTTALCAPTRTALLSGRNHHVNNMGSITETATAFPGNTGQRPDNVAYISHILRLNGYSTAHFGKNHETAAWEVSPSGPTDRWPTRQGFDKFYGFFGGETNQWAPLVYDGLTPVELPDDPNYNFMTDMTNKSIEWVRFQRALTPSKPFFMYFAPGAVHAPHHVPQKWIAKYRGQFDQGWDELRRQTLARQIRLGVVPKGTELAPRPADVRDWSALSADEKRLAARQMEVFAAFAEYADDEIGRLIDALRLQGDLDNTLVFYILGDNGTSAEGGPNGVFNELSSLNLVPETVPDMLKHYDHWGDPTTYPHMAYGWAIAGNTPFSWAKQIASDFGGTRNGMIVHWPKRYTQHGEVRNQFSHVIDIAPTILQAAGLPEPKIVDGIPQQPMQGTSLLPTFADARAPTRNTQYFEILGNRAIYQDGWYARIVHSAPWAAKPFATLQAEQWELYDTRSDFSLVHDVAVKYPDKVKELSELFMKEASANHALPIDDRRFERLNAGLVGRPDLMGGRTAFTLYPGMQDMGENVFINVKNKSSSITAEIEVPAGGANGVLLAQGGRFGGYSLYLQDGKLRYTYNFVGLNRTTIGSDQPLPAGKSTIRYEFAYDGGGAGKGGVGTLYVNGKEVARGRIEATAPFIFSLDETADVGRDNATPVVEDYGVAHGVFNGTIRRVTVDIGDAAVSGRAAAN